MDRKHILEVLDQLSEEEIKELVYMIEANTYDDSYEAVKERVCNTNEEISKNLLMLSLLIDAQFAYLYENIWSVDELTDTKNNIMKLIGDIPWKKIIHQHPEN